MGIIAVLGLTLSPMNRGIRSVWHGRTPRADTTCEEHGYIQVLWP